MNDLELKYGYCIIPKNTFLFRGYPNMESRDVLYFGTKFHVAKGFNQNVQVWKTRADIKVLFMIDSLKGSHVKSSISEIYSSYFPETENENFNDLDIKQHRNRSSSFINMLQCNHKINGWFSSLEDKEEVEICLFNKAIINDGIHLVEVLRDKGKYFNDSLVRFRMFPSESFYHNTNENKINNFVKPYHEYVKGINEFIKESCLTVDEIRQAKQSYYNMRNKLKL